MIACLSSALIRAQFAISKTVRPQPIQTLFSSSVQICTHGEAVGAKRGDVASEEFIILMLTKILRARDKRVARRASIHRATPAPALFFPPETL